MQRLVLLFFEASCGFRGVGCICPCLSQGATLGCSASGAHRVISAGPYLSFEEKQATVCDNCCRATPHAQCSQGYWVHPCLHRHGPLAAVRRVLVASTPTMHGAVHRVAAKDMGCLVQVMLKMLLLGSRMEWLREMSGPSASRQMVVTPLLSSLALASGDGGIGPNLRAIQLLPCTMLCFPWGLRPSPSAIPGAH